MDNFKIKECAYKDCSNEFKAFKTTDKFCSGKCAFKAKPVNLSLKNLNPINKVSDKRKIENLKYKVLRIEFLGKPENQICFIDGCNRKANTIEHRAGRWGTNFLDTSTWAGCCSECNIELENNPEMAKKYQLSKITGNPKKDN